MKVTINGCVKEIIFNPDHTVEEVSKMISSEPIYMFVQQKRFVSSRQIYQSPNMSVSLLNLNLKLKPPSSYFDLLELELDGERVVWAPIGVRLPNDVPANPLYFKGTTGIAVRERRKIGEYMPFDEVHAYTEDRLPSTVYTPKTEPVEPRRRPQGFEPSRCNRNVGLAELAAKVEKFGVSIFSNGSIKFEEATFNEDGSMVVLEWTPSAQRLVDRMNRVVQFKVACRRTIYDRPTFGRGGVDWVETFAEEPPKTEGVPFRHVNMKLQYQRQRVEPHMSPFLAGVATAIGVSVGKLKERLLKRVKRNTFPFYYNGLLERYFGTIQIPPYEDFLNYLKSDDRIDYVFMWEFVSRPGLFPKGVNLLLYDADRQVLVFPTLAFSGLGYQNGAETLALVKEGHRFSPMTVSTQLRVKEWFSAPLNVAALDKGAKGHVVFEGKVLGVQEKCLVPCKPTMHDEWVDSIEYADVRKMPPKETVEYLESVGANPRYSYVEKGKCVGIWTEGMLFVPCEEGETVLPLPELEAWREFIELKGVDATRLEKSRQRWFERRQYAAYKKLHGLHGEKVGDYVIEVDEFMAPCYSFQKKLVILRRFKERLEEELLCSL